jgi:hypothetical protein
MNASTKDESSPKGAPHSRADASPKHGGPAHHAASPKSAPVPKPESPKHRPHDISPRNSANIETNDDDASKPSAAELAKKRAERFGIPLLTKDESKGHEVRPDDRVVQTESPETESSNKEKKPNAMEKFRELIASSLEQDSIITLEDLVSDSRNANLFQKVIDQSGEEKVRDIIKEVVSKIKADFKDDRSSIESPPRLAGFRVSRALKAALPKLPRTDRKEKEAKREDKREDKRDDKRKEHKNDGKKGGKWTDDEWAEWNKKKGQSDWKSNDWNSGNKRKDWGDKRDDKWDSKKKRSYEYDSFESDVEEFIYRNRLDKKASKILREETKGMVTYVMDQGFDLKRYDNPSREVMLRCKDYIRMKKDDRGGNSRGGRSARGSSRSRSPSRSRKSRSRSRSARDGHRSGDRSPSRGRSPSRSNSRDRYRDRSRSASV